MPRFKAYAIDDCLCLLSQSPACCSLMADYEALNCACSQVLNNSTGSVPYDCRESKTYGRPSVIEGVAIVVEREQPAISLDELPGIW